MNKTQIDKYFTAKHKELQNYIKARFTQKTIIGEDVDYFLTECYLFILDRADKIEDEKMLKNFISNFIYQHTGWTNSEYRELGRKDQQSKLVDAPVTYFDRECDNELELKIEQEQKDALNVAINQAYYNTLTKLEDKIAWEIYFVEGKNTLSLFSKHIGRSKMVARGYINKLKAGLREFEKTQLTK